MSHDKIVDIEYYFVFCGHSSPLVSFAGQSSI